MLSKARSRIASIASVALLFTLLTTVQAAAEPPNSFDEIADVEQEKVLSSTPGELMKSADQGESTVASSEIGTTDSGFQGVACTGGLDFVHYSNGAGGAIFKVRVNCTGTGLDRVNVRLRGLISFSPTVDGNLQKRAESDQTRTITVNAASPTTYYVPVSGNAGVGNGYWVRTATIQITSPGLGNVDSQTGTQQANIGN